MEKPTIKSSEKGIIKHVNRYSVAGLIIMLLIISVSAIKLYDSLPKIETILTDNGKTIVQKITSAENAYISAFPSLNMKLIELYSNVTKVQGQQVMKVANYTYAKDSNGVVHKIFPRGNLNFKPQVDSIIKEVKYVQSKNIKTIVAILPPNVVEGVTKLPKGIVDYQNMYADKVLSQLKENNVYSIDMRTSMTDMGVNMNNLFFTTDHHWRIQNAFIGKNIIVNSLNSKYKLGIDPRGFYANLNNYTVKTYKNIYEGAYTTATGSSFVGKPDDFTTILPKFDTQFRFLGYNPDESLKKDLTLNKPCDLTGSFQNVLFDKTFITKGTKDYQAYLRGVIAKCIIENKKTTSKLKVLILGTSQSRPLAAFLSLTVKSVANIDQQQGDNKESSNEFIKRYKPNVIIFLYAPSTFNKVKIFNYDWKIK